MAGIEMGTVDRRDPPQLHSVFRGVVTEEFRQYRRAGRQRVYLGGGAPVDEQRPFVAIPVHAVASPPRHPTFLTVQTNTDRRVVCTRC